MQIKTGGRFPILNGGGRTIPWHVAEMAYARYAELYGHGQSLARIAQRGGFDERELDMLYPDWRAAASRNSPTRQGGKSPSRRSG
jgi:hypothetical protein